MSWRILAAGLAATAALLFTLGLGLSHDARPPPSAVVGQAAPELELASLAGGKLSLADLRGEPVVVSFWASWCEPCRQEHATLLRAAQALQGHVRFVGIALDEDPAQVRRFLEDHGTGYPMLLDPQAKAAAAWGASGLPTTFFLDARGVVVSQVQGPLNAKALIEHIKPLFRPAAR